MKKWFVFLFTLLLMSLLVACNTGENNCKIEYDSDGRIISKIYHDDEGNVLSEHTYTYYESGAKHKERIDYHQTTPTNPLHINVEEIEWSEDGLVQRTLSYNSDGKLVGDSTLKYYANKKDNWHKDFDSQTWQYQKSISYSATGTCVHVEYEYMDDHTYVERSFHDEEGKVLANEMVRGWNASDEAWSKRIKHTYYDHEGFIREVTEYNVDGYDRKTSCFFYEEDQEDYYQWFDAENNLQQFGQHAENGKLITHTLSSPQWTLKWGLVKNGGDVWHLMMEECDANDVSRVTTRYSTLDGSVVSVEKKDENDNDTFCETYYTDGTVKTKSGYTSGEQTSYIVYDQNGTETFRYDCTNTSYHLVTGKDEKGDVQLYVVEGIAVKITYYFQGTELVKTVSIL